MVHKDTYLSLNQTMEILGVSRSTMYAWNKRGLLKAVRDPLTNRHYYSKVQIEKALNRLDVAFSNLEQESK